MKNLLIHISPEHNFNDGWDGELERLVKVQIDSAKTFGWETLLVTNFPYEYNGVKAIVVGDENFCAYKPTVSKIYTIVTLFKMGLITEDMWFHDFDAFQLEPLDIELTREVAMTDYGILSKNNSNNLRPSTGTIFFKPTSLDIFEAWKAENDKMLTNEEVTLLAMSHKSRFKWLFDRIEKINITYNFATRRRNLELTYEITDKPIKVIHFHPWDRRRMYFIHPESTNMDVCVEGKNWLGKPLISQTLLELFKKHHVN